MFVFFCPSVVLPGFNLNKSVCDSWGSSHKFTKTGSCFSACKKNINGIDKFKHEWIEYFIFF